MKSNGVVNVVCSNIITQNGKFLFVSESKPVAVGQYSLPAGRLEFEETWMEGAIREAEEETGLLVEPISLIGIYQRPNSAENTNTTAFVFHSKVIGGEIRRSKKHPWVGYLSYERVVALGRRGLLRSMYMRPAIADFLVGKGVPVEFLTVIP